MKLYNRLISSEIARPFNLSLKTLLSLKVQLIRIASISVATTANNLLAFVINVIAARKLGVEGFGVFSLAFAVTTLVGVLGDVGFNLSMIRLFNKYSSESEKQVLVIASALVFKVLLLSVVFLFSLSFASEFVQHFGLGLETQRLFAIAFATGGLLFLWTYIQAYLQAYHRFKILTLFIWGYFGLRLLCLPVAYGLFPKTPLAWLAATYTLPLIVLICVGLAQIGIRVIPLALMRLRPILDSLKELLGYGKWVALSVIAYTSMPHMLRFILAKRASVEEVGIFSAGMMFTVAFSTLNTAVRTVIFPQVTALEGREEMRRYLSKLAQIAPLYIGFAVLGIACLGILQWTVLGEEYRQAMPVFLVTASSLAIVTFLGLGTMLVHTMMQPQVDAWVNVVRLGSMALLSLVMTPSLHALGAGIVYVVPLLSGEIWMFWYVKKKSMEKP